MHKSNLPCIYFSPVLKQLPDTLDLTFQSCQVKCCVGSFILIIQDRRIFLQKLLQAPVQSLRLTWSVLTTSTKICAFKYRAENLGIGKKKTRSSQTYHYFTTHTDQRQRQRWTSRQTGSSVQNQTYRLPGYLYWGDWQKLENKTDSLWQYFFAYIRISYPICHCLSIHLCHSFSRFNFRCDKKTTSLLIPIEFGTVFELGGQR